MEKFVCAVFVSIVAVALVQVTAAQTVHVVGDSMGWEIPTSGGAGAYSTWAASRRFMVGDTLLFNFATNDHDVLQVTKESFDACTSSNSIGDAITVGPANVTLSSAEDHYYICTFGRHCQAGQKLAITISSASPGPSSPSPNPSPRPPTTGGTTTNTPSPADCAPVPALGPTGSTTDRTVSPPGSSSSMVVASFVVSVVSVVMGLVF